ncbi:hypothetical protein [Runella sp.]|uniref:hypothetical protein n=1 Tax=Runella sp. TaxID=1960881 RepID=UPI003D097806
MTQIDNLPVKALTDEEICKLFFKRFDANALVMIYVDKQGKSTMFGRLYRRTAVFNTYRRLCYWASRVMDFHNWKQIENDHD